ncbi:MAG TPA: hypothetical protein VKF14_06815 [Candidatus Dormibacteraeota bacterium]|nr:hypothetical protein [Candidatus Dormibacteraeota bacterium]
MLFERRLRDGIREGTITMAFRRWRRCQVVPGRRYRTGDGFVEVVRVDEVEPPSITELEAHEAGYSSRAELLGDLRGSAEWPVYRLGLRRVDEADPRQQLADSDQLTAIDVDGIERALDRLDGATRAPWTRAALGAIAAHPGVRAADLAATLGFEVIGFKANVRKLKALGLTISLAVGYRLSPRGRAYLRLTRRGVV